MSKIALRTLSATERCDLSTKELLARFGQKQKIIINILSNFSTQILIFRVNSSLIHLFPFVCAYMWEWKHEIIKNYLLKYQNYLLEFRRNSANSLLTLFCRKCWFIHKTLQRIPRLLVKGILLVYEFIQKLFHYTISLGIFKSDNLFPPR